MFSCGDETTLKIPEWLGQIITWLIIVIGWFIVDKANSKREERKSRQNKADQLIVKIHEIEDLSITFHTGEQADQDLAQKINRSIQQVINKVLWLHLCNDKRLLMELRQSITLHNFDSSSFQSQEQKSELISEIYASCDALTANIEKVVHQKNKGLFC